MANKFLELTKQALRIHGMDATYTSVTASVYDIESGRTNITTTTHVVRVYKKHIKATQYNYPNMIGKDSAMFYLANDNLPFNPKFKDRITYAGVEYTVDTRYDHIALGQVVLIKLLAVKM